jgi:hypothetical protein
MITLDVYAKQLNSLKSNQKFVNALITDHSKEIEIFINRYGNTLYEISGQDIPYVLTSITQVLSRRTDHVFQVSVEALEVERRFKELKPADVVVLLKALGKCSRIKPQHKEDIPLLNDCSKQWGDTFETLSLYDRYYLIHISATRIVQYYDVMDKLEISKRAKDFSKYCEVDIQNTTLRAMMFYLIDKYSYTYDF